RRFPAGRGRRRDQGPQLKLFAMFQGRSFSGAAGAWSRSVRRSDFITRVYCLHQGQTWQGQFCLAWRGELFKIMTGVNMVHVPYRGNAPALTDLIAGQVQVMFADTPSSIEHVKSGKLRALAVTTAERSEILPGVPTVGEFLPGFEASNWFGVAAP